ncbi:MAG TPA: 3'(2'),5'-bisphosphate nucleotidase CysQ [Nitrospiraceae bacterium]|nr:3'(2'),5'-bisphosphate nucleotidase CysQ [Nitrospiraceae bacterium]
MDRELHILVEAMKQAGRQVLDLTGESLSIHTKADHSPVTTADWVVDRVIHEAISRQFPDDGWLSEERPDDFDRLNKKRTWILDPIDGTRAFIKKIPEFCISAALVENGFPVIAAILNPSTDELFTAIRGRGTELLQGANRQSQPAFQDDTPLVLVNPWDWRRGRFQTVAHRAQCRPVGSIAFALANVAVGRAAAAVMLEGGNEWDVAAGVLLIEENGGVITDIHGGPVRFNQPDPRLRGILATGRDVDPSLRVTLGSLASPLPSTLL